MRRVLTGMVLASVLALAACTSTDGATDPTAQTPAPAAAESGESATEVPADTNQVAAASSLHLAGADVEVEILPLVRSGEHVVLTMDLTMADAEDTQAFLYSALGGTSPHQLPSLAGVRLVDLGRDVVHTVALGADGRTVTTGRDFITLAAGTSMRLQVAYAAPPDDVTSLGLFLPGGPYVEQVPVVDGDVPPSDLPEGSDDGSAPDPLDLAVVATAEVVPLESFTGELAGAVQTLTTTEQVQVTLGADVLFDVDSAQLGEAAQAALDAAAAHLESREPGTVHVVGHTDDIASEAYNQDLSERRAQAVAAALAERIDTARFPVEHEGRGKNEPLVPNTDDESRAMNRRVTLTLASEITETVELTTEGDLPPFDRGPVGPGTDGVLVGSQGTYRITAPQARRVDGHVVLDLQVSPVDERAEVGVSFLDGVWHYRGDAYSVQRSASGVVLLRGATVVHPMDYLAGVADNGVEQWLPMTDLETLGVLAPGATRTFSILYPDVGDLDEITVQVGGGLGQEAFRLTGIPVR